MLLRPPPFSYREDKEDKAENGYPVVTSRTPQQLAADASRERMRKSEKD
jgi:hypothetical protein